MLSQFMTIKKKIKESRKFIKQDEWYNDLANNVFVFFSDVIHLQPAPGQTHVPSIDDSHSGVSTPDPSKPKKVIYEVIVWPLTYMLLVL